MFLLLSALSEAPAQELASAWVGYQPTASLTQTDGAQIPGSDGALDDLEVDIIAAALSAKIPPLTLVPERWLLVNGLGVLYNRPRLSGLPEEAAVSDEQGLLSLTWQLLSVARLSDRWTAVASVIPGLHSNFEAPLSSRDFLLQYLAFVNWTPSETLTLGLGGSYTSVFGVPRALPLLSLNLTGERWRLGALLPSRAALLYEVIDDRTAVGLKYMVHGGYYHRGSEEPAYPEDIYVHYSVATAGPAVEQPLGESPLRVAVDVGYTVFRRFDLYQSDDPLYAFELERTWSARAMLSLTPSPPDR